VIRIGHEGRSKDGGRRYIRWSSGTSSTHWSAYDPTHRGAGPARSHRAGSARELERLRLARGLVSGDRPGDGGDSVQHPAESEAELFLFVVVADALNLGNQDRVTYQPRPGPCPAAENLGELVLPVRVPAEMHFISVDCQPPRQWNGSYKHPLWRASI
jgi:hypothetical protein